MKEKIYIFQNKANKEEDGATRCFELNTFYVFDDEGCIILEGENIPDFEENDFKKFDQKQEKLKQNNPNHKIRLWIEEWGKLYLNTIHH